MHRPRRMGNNGRGRERCQRARHSVHRPPAEQASGELTSDRSQLHADDFSPGLEGVIAFETEIAEPDKDGGALRYRGVDIEDLVGHVTFGNVWALLVDGKFGPGLPPAEPFPIPVHTGDVRVDVQAALAMLSPIWGYRPLLDISDDEAREQAARASVMALSYVAQSARGIGAAGGAAVAHRPVPHHRRAVHGALARRAGPASTSTPSTPTSSRPPSTA